MQLEIYLQETRELAEYNENLLEGVRVRLQRKESLSNLEKSGVLHALQLLIENAIGKAKHTLKYLNKTVPISAYDVFTALVECGVIPESESEQWSAVIGLRNKIVHDYMNIDMGIVLQFIRDKRYELVMEFLLQPIPKL